VASDQGSTKLQTSAQPVHATRVCGCTCPPASPPPHRSCIWPLAPPPPMVVCAVLRPLLSVCLLVCCCPAWSLCVRRRWECSTTACGAAVTRPVVRLELAGRPVIFTRIMPESKSTSMLIRSGQHPGGGGAAAAAASVAYMAGVGVEQGHHSMSVMNIVAGSKSNDVLIKLGPWVTSAGLCIRQGGGL
jgi:hypothetical protein